MKIIWPLRIAASPLIVADTPYMGPLIEPEYFDSAMRAFDSLFKKHKIHFVRMMLYGPYSLDTISNLGYDIIIRHTHILDLTKDEDYLWKKMEGRSRTTIRKAIKLGVVIVEADHRDSIDTYYAMYKDLYRRQQLYLANTKQFFQLMWDLFHPENFALLVAEHHGTPVAGIISIRFKESCYYLDGVSLKAYNHLAPNNLLQWEDVLVVGEEIKHFPIPVFVSKRHRRTG